MNPRTHNINRNDAAGRSDAGTTDDTLRLIARLPVPDGLEDRVKAGLCARSASALQTARVLDWNWRSGLRSHGDWMRAAAAAAIVFVVAAGGWGVYTHVLPTQQLRGMVQPRRMAAPGGFSSAGAIRTPNTLNGPAVAHPGPAQPAKPAARTAQKKTRRTPSNAANKGAAPPVEPAAK